MKRLAQGKVTLKVILWMTTVQYYVRIIPYLQFQYSARRY